MLVLIVDSSVQIIERIEEILLEVTCITTIKNALSYQDAVMGFNTYQPDVVVLDGYLPSNLSLQLLSYIKQVNASISTIVLYNGSNDCLKDRYMQVGASHVLDKYHEFDKISTIINAINGSNAQKAFTL